MNDDVKNIFEAIKYQCRPNKDKEDFELIFELFFAYGQKRPNFVGGQNDKRNTLHENIFKAMFPELESQVTFGTGKDGYKKIFIEKIYS